MQKIILKGKPVVEELKLKLAQEIEKLNKPLTLAILIVGDDPASHIYKNHLVKIAQNFNINVQTDIFPQEATTEQVVQKIHTLNNDDSIYGIMPMLPMPKHIDNDKISAAISMQKDVDCLNPESVGLVYLGKNNWAPCTACAVMEILKFYNISLQGKNVVIIGRSNVVGKPLFALMLKENATVTICHSKTVDLAKITKTADIIVAAVGVSNFVQQDMVKDDAILIDVGINQVGDSIVGDVDALAYNKAIAYTPVPGGVGTVSSMMLMQKFLNNCL